MANLLKHLCTQYRLEDRKAVMRGGTYFPIFLYVQAQVANSHGRRTYLLTFLHLQVAKSRGRRTYLFPSYNVQVVSSRGRRTFLPSYIYRYS